MIIVVWGIRNDAYFDTLSNSDDIHAGSGIRTAVPNSSALPFELRSAVEEVILEYVTLFRDRCVCVCVYFTYNVFIKTR